MEETLTGDRASAQVGGAGGPIGRVEYWVMLSLLISLGVADTVLCTVNLYYYTDTYAQFFNQVRGNLRRRALPRLLFVHLPVVLTHHAISPPPRRSFTLPRRAHQGTGIVYIIVSIPIVLYRRRRRSLAEAAAAGGLSSLQQLSSSAGGGGGGGDGRPSPPLWVLVCIGCLNGTGNFFAAIGANQLASLSKHTPADPSFQPSFEAARSSRLPNQH